MKLVQVLQLPDGSEPFEEWISTLTSENRALIDSYIDRVSYGGSRKNIKALKGGLFEIKINSGPGWRVYFAEEHSNMIKSLWSAYVSEQ